MDQVLTASDRVGHADDLERLRAHLDQVTIRRVLDDVGQLHALRRRVSRESGAGTRVIELAAHLLMASVLSSNLESLDVVRVDECDGATLRVIARLAVLLGEDSRRLVLHSTWSPLSGSPLADSDAARAALLRTVFLSCRFNLQVVNDGSLPPRDEEFEPDAESIEHDLVAHNYERVLLAAEKSAGSGPDANALRASALAAVNLGWVDRCSEMLADAALAATDSGLVAHIYCLQALIAMKRRSDRGSARQFVQQGLEVLNDAEVIGGDLAVEQAWLLNAEALIESLEYTKSGDLGHWTRAWDLEQQALDLVAQGASADRTYLRFNLIANCAMLLELTGDYAAAALVFQKVFTEHSEVASDPSPGSPRATLGYRLGVLHARAGRLDDASDVLEGLVDELPVEEWNAVDHLLRARSRVAAAAGRTPEARALAARGYRIAKAVRSADAAEAHGTLLAQLLDTVGQHVGATTVRAELATWGLRSDADVSIGALRPKLPAYIPEIDLEDVPSVDTNQALTTRPCGQSPNFVGVK